MAMYNGLQVNTQQRSNPYSLISPVGGLNGRDSISALPETDAYEMDNLFPGTSSVTMRNGCDNHITSIGVPCVSLATYGGGTSDKMLAFGGNKVYDVSIPDVAAELKGDLLSADVVTTMFGTVADNALWLIITTGFDTPMSYDGTSLTNLVITGALEATTNFNCVANYKGRLFFGTRNRLCFYYLAPGAIQGAADIFDLGQLATKGGSLAAIATYSQDSGNGPDDYILFVTSRGEYLLFTGTDPGDANAWSLVGRYSGPTPIGRKCVMNYGGDVVVLTDEGAVQFSQIQRMSDSKTELTTVTAKLGSLLSRRSKYRDTPCWSMVLYPRGGWLMVSAPDSTSASGMVSHFVMNTITNAWCRFTSDKWNGISWTIFNGKLYFGRYDGAIRLADTLNSDVGSDIIFSCKQAYSPMGTIQSKHFKWADFLVSSEAQVPLAARISLDFTDVAPQVTPMPLGDSLGADWDVDYWDTGVWGQDPYTQKWTASVLGMGMYASIWLRGQVAGASFEWFNTRVVFEKAEGLL